MRTEGAGSGDHAATHGERKPWRGEQRCNMWGTATAAVWEEAGGDDAQLGGGGEREE